MPSQAKAATFLVGATLFWAGNYVVGAGAVRSMSPLSLVYLRWLLAVVPLVLIAHLVEKPAWRAVLRRWAVLAALAMLGLVGYTLLVYHALRHTSPLNAALINSFNPALIVVASAAFLRERVGWRGTGGLALGLLGVVLVLSGGRVRDVFAVRYNFGDLLMLAAIGCWTAYTILARTLTGVPPVAATAVQAVIAVAVLTPFAAAGHVALPPTREAAASLLYIAVFPSVISYLLWNSALATIPPGKAGLFLNLITVFTAAASVLMGKPVTLPQVAGGLLVLAGVLLAGASKPVARAAAER